MLSTEPRQVCDYNQVLISMKSIPTCSRVRSFFLGQMNVLLWIPLLLAASTLSCWMSPLAKISLPQTTWPPRVPPECPCWRRACKRTLRIKPKIISPYAAKDVLNTCLDEREVLTTITKVVPPGRGCSIALRSGRKSKKIHFREVSWLFLSVSDSFSKFLRFFKVFREVLR